MSAVFVRLRRRRPFKPRNFTGVRRRPDFFTAERAETPERRENDGTDVSDGMGPQRLWFTGIAARGGQGLWLFSVRFEPAERRKSMKTYTFLGLTPFTFGLPPTI